MWIMLVSQGLLRKKETSSEFFVFISCICNVFKYRIRKIQTTAVSDQEYNSCIRIVVAFKKVSKIELAFPCAHLMIAVFGIFGLKPNFSWRICLLCS
jgi:hypothetical protein